jgi:hypothetical protein
MKSYTNIRIPITLYNRFKDMLPSVRFDSVEEYLIYVLRVEVAKYNMEQDGEELSEEEEELIKKRLRELGYLE